MKFNTVVAQLKAFLHAIKLSISYLVTQQLTNKIHTLVEKN